MPRKSKITAVPVDQPEVTVADAEPNTEAQEMTEIMNDIKSVQAEEPVSEPVVAEPTAEPAVLKDAEPKAKPKRAPKAKAKAKSLPEPVLDITPTLDEAVVEVQLPTEAKTEAKVSCPDCGKQMSAKTLKYSHGPNCLVKKKASHEVKTEQPVVNINDEMIEELVQTRMNNVKRDRLAKREQALEKLIAGALPS